MAAVQVTERAEWICRCSDDEVECPHLRPRLAELACDDALVTPATFNTIDARDAKFYLIDRRVTPSDSAFKLESLGDWRIQCKYRDMCSVSLIKGSSSPPSSDLRECLSYAFSALLVHLNHPYMDTWQRTAIRDTVTSAEEFGIPPQVILRAPDHNILHVLASKTNIDGLLRTVASMCEEVRDIVEPDEFRQMILARDSTGRTPRDYATTYAAGESDLLRLLQPIGPKSAAGAE